jgi:3-oxoacyl-[acyl-carrier protein] reductase
MHTQPGTALVTGGGSGIGLAIARALLARGWTVSLCGRDGGKLEEAAAELIPAAGGETQRIHWVTADVSIAENVKRWVGEAERRLGRPGLLVNNAGIGVWGEITSLAEEDWDRVLDVNLKGIFLCTREVLPSMRAGGGGYVVNTSSASGKKGMAGSSAYCSSKFGVIGFTESLIAEEKNNNIRATAICPGFVATPMVTDVGIPAPEMIQPEDVAATVLYLLDLSPQVILREIVMERVGA